MSTTNSAALLEALTPKEREICAAFALRVFDEINAGRLVAAQPDQCTAPEKLPDTQALIELAYHTQDVIHLTAISADRILDDLKAGLL
ncbi:MAG: hypothetical protein RBS35_12020 [Azonexus sp.]|jgi:hypothetical protein|nr:hypothetical protein [Azonexus sp.]